MQQKSKEEKEELIQLYKQSGMSVRAFAEEFELNLGTHVLEKILGALKAL